MSGVFRKLSKLSTIFRQRSVFCPRLFLKPGISIILAQNIVYPRWKSASFLFAENTLERFGYYGVRSVLILFLRDMLAYDDDTGKVQHSC